jgi:hypothetical protein
VESNTSPVTRGLALLLAVIFGPTLYIGGMVWLFSNGMAALAELCILLGVGGAVGSGVVWQARRTLFPRFAEFDGQVIRQSVVKDDESPDEHHVAIDDGIRLTAWDLKVESKAFRLLAPGTFVHARVNLDDRKQVTVLPLEPAAVARPLADVAAEQQLAGEQGRAVRGQLVDRDDQHRGQGARRE